MLAAPRICSRPFESSVSLAFSAESDRVVVPFPSPLVAG